MNNQTVSVAMCTYNGAKYLHEQLDSILTQTRVPNELIVCDDGSTDATLKILDEFKKKAQFLVKIYCNVTRLGSTKNFEKAISLCSGEIIVLSDQDDVWLPLKLERIEQVFREQPDAGYTFSNALVVDEMLHPLGYTMWDQALFTCRERRRFKKGQQIDIFLKRNVVTGATMAFRRRLNNLVLPIPELWIHDAWISLLGSAVGERGVIIGEPLIKYRQHSMQVIGGRKLSVYEQYQRAKSIHGETYSNAKTRFLEALERLISIGKCNIDVQRSIDRKIQHLIVRQNLIRCSLLKRIKLIAQEFITFRYHKYSNGWKSVAKDLLITK